MAAARRAALQEALDHILANRAGALAGADPEYLHQLRVGTRRLRAALTVFGDMMRAADVRALRRMLRALARITGPARDWDVFLPHAPAPLRPLAERRRRSAYAALRRVLRAPQLWLLPRSQAVPRVPLPVFASQVLERAERKTLRRGARTDWSRAGKRHALRIRLRRLRYAGEFLHGAFPDADPEPFIHSLKDLQDLLGELNDLEVARRLRAELAGSPPRSGTRKPKLIAQLPAAWKAFAAAPRFWR